MREKIVTILNQIALILEIKGENAFKIRAYRNGSELIENYGGAFPLWLAPNQVGIATISRDQNEYASKVRKELVSRGIRVVEDLRNEKITYKIREFSLMKLPLVIVLGKAEVEQNLVSVRKRGSKESNSKSLSEFLEDVTEELEQDA